MRPLWGGTRRGRRRRAEPIDFERPPLFARHEKLALSARGVRAARSENVVQVFAPPSSAHIILARAYCYNAYTCLDDDIYIVICVLYMCVCVFLFIRFPSAPTRPVRCYNIIIFYYHYTYKNNNARPSTRFQPFLLHPVTSRRPRRLLSYYYYCRA